MNTKNKILIIASTLPYYDRYSGDRRLLNILTILAKEYEIVYFSRNTNEYGSDKKYVDELTKLGATVFINRFDFKEYILNTPISAIFIEFYYMAEEYMPKIRILRPDIPIIVDSVDVHYHREYLKYKITKNEKDLTKSMETKKRELAVYRGADLVIAVSDEDKRIMHMDSADINIAIIPNIYHRPKIAKEIKDKNSLIFIGNFDRDPNVDAMIYFCKEILPLLKIEVPRIRLKIIGSNINDTIKNLANNNVEVIGYVPSLTEYFQKSYIAIAPLRYGSGMKGKVCEAMAHGIPVVTTSIGTQGMGLTNKENAMVADTSKEFIDHIVELLNDEQLYKKVSSNSLDYIENNLSIEKTQSAILRIFKNISCGVPKRMPVVQKMYYLINYGYEHLRAN